MEGKLDLFCLLIYFSYLILLSFANATEEINTVVELTEANVNQVLADHDAVVINFYASWCPYSRNFKPEFLEAGKLLREKFGTGEPKAAAASIDCVAQVALEERFGVSKYPTVKISLHGKILDNEYRGKREAKSILHFVEGYLKDTTGTLQTSSDFDQIQRNKPAAIAYITQPNNVVHKLVKKVAAWLKASCPIYVTHVGDRLPVTLDLTKDHVFLKEEDNDVEHSTEYTENITSENHLYEWLKKRCQPTIQELTFENAEELSEPGIPFLVLFRQANDANSLELYKSAIKRELTDFWPHGVRTLIADGNIFVHPLHQAGKSEADLPIILLDSFVHMYVFKNFTDLEIPGKLKQFMEDYKSNKLHQNYHQEEMAKFFKSVTFEIASSNDLSDEDPSDEQDDAIKQIQGSQKNAEDSKAKGTLQSEEKPRETATETPVTTPPESSFKYLQPSRHRYTFKRDEL